MVKHGTSSVFVFARQRPGWHIGLIHHPRYGRMMLPGGHVEAGESPAQAAFREVEEETGLAVRLVGPPAAPLPAGYLPPRVEQPWWIVEYPVPPDSHATAPHVHIDYLYVALALHAAPAGSPAHPFGWYPASAIGRLEMFDDTRALAAALMDGLTGAGPGDDDAGLVAAVMARLQACAGLPG
jgi:8-oxo-dGTP pyrophosphatase MutT (NUDIX family)